MTYSINKDEIRKIAEELGLQVTFNSDTPGVLNLKTGERKPIASYFEDYFMYESVLENDADLDNLRIKAKKIKPNRLGEKKLTIFQSLVEHGKIA